MLLDPWLVDNNAPPAHFANNSSLDITIHHIIFIWVLSNVVPVPMIVGSGEVYPAVAPVWETPDLRQRCN